MESPVVVDKPPEYHGSAASNNERGFPFDDEEGTGAWSELAARHPDIAVRLRQRPATWARKRRPSSQDAADDFGDSFGGFDRFPFDDIPSEFREHFPTHWNRRFGSREEPQHPQPSSPQPQSHSPQHQTIATQTEEEPGPSNADEQTSLPNYGLRNTVDLGQKSAADPSLADADDRNQRSMSAPPDSCANNQHTPRKMSGHQEQQHPQPEFQSSNVRHIPIFVEGRDEPVINKTVDHGSHFGEPKPSHAYAPPPPPPHVDREQYYDDVPHGFHHPPNFSRTFGTPFNKGFRQGAQPFVQQKVYPQSAFARGASPQRSQSPKPQMHPEEHYVKVPVHHEQAPPRAETPSKSQPKQSPRQQTPPQQVPPQQASPKQPTPPPQPKPQPTATDPITQILSIQTDVLNLMTEVENFTGTKKDKKYMFLDEMLTRNLIKLDNIETEGKENIRQARKEAIKCIQKCIAVLEAKADNKGAEAPQQTQDVEMESAEEKQPANEATVENGEVEMKEPTKEEANNQPQDTQQQEQPQEKLQAEEPSAKAEVEMKEEPKEAEGKKEDSQPPAVNAELQSEEKIETAQPELADTRPEETKISEPQTEVKQDEQKSQESVENKKTPKKGTKTVKKRDKSKDKKEPKEKDTSSKDENVDKKEEKLEAMEVDGKGDKIVTQTMEVDGAASQ